MLLREIALVGTAVVEFVAVCLGMHGAEDGTKFRQVDLPDARQLVIDLLLLELQLLWIGEVLPLAATTDAEVLTERNRAYITIFNKAHHLALGKGVLLAADLDVAHITRHAERHEHHEVVPVEQALSLGSHRLYLNALKER